jgi:hypothetical protein
MEIATWIPPHHDPAWAIRRTGVQREAKENQVTQSCSAVLVITKSDHDSRSCQGEETLRGAIKRSLMRLLTD